MLTSPIGRPVAAVNTSAGKLFKSFNAMEYCTANIQKSYTERCSIGNFRTQGLVLLSFAY